MNILHQETRNCVKVFRREVKALWRVTLAQTWEGRSLKTEYLWKLRSREEVRTIQEACHYGERHETLGVWVNETAHRWREMMNASNVDWLET